jgi:hypothetical protein
VSRLSAPLDQKTPFEHHVFRYWQDPAFEHGPNFQLGSSVGVIQRFNTKANFRERHGEATTFASGFSRRSSDSTLVSSRKPLTLQSRS